MTKKRTPKKNLQAALDELEKKYSELSKSIEDAEKKLESTVSLQKELETAKYDIRILDAANRGLKEQLEKVTAGNKELKAGNDVVVHKLNLTYHRVLDLGAKANEWQHIAQYWTKQYDSSLETILSRGVVRSKYDTPYGIWRDNSMERMVCGSDGPIDAIKMSKALEKAVHGQLPNGSNDFLTAMKLIAEEFGYELRGPHFCLKTNSKERTQAQRKGFELLFGFPSDVVAENMGKSEQELLDAVSGRAVEDVHKDEDQSVLKKLDRR